MSSADPIQELKACIDEAPCSPKRIAAFLDALDHSQRVVAVRALGRADQRKLYAAVDGFLPVTLTELVPPSTGDVVAVRHFGKNTLPAFTHFEKRFCRPRGCDAEKPERLYGFNFQTMAPVTGPGYFVAVEDPVRPEVLVDYNHVPGDATAPDATLPADWPAVRHNERGLSRFVYGFMIDTLRRVSEHVTIGSAARKGRDMGSWFVLCREE